MDYFIAVLGARGAGKTALVRRFITGEFPVQHRPTVEDVYSRVVGCDKGVCTLRVIDTTGSYNFPAMRRLAIYKAKAILLVYSVTDKNSFQEAKTLYELVHSVKTDLLKVPVVLVGTKTDLTDQRDVKKKEGTELELIWNCGFLEVTVKDEEQVTDVFRRVFELETRWVMTLTPESQKYKRRCGCLPLKTWAKPE
ncbi:GTP-binding protein Di-Ras2-like [Branchiostoma floridae x Branchiostoma belcheri]